MITVSDRLARQISNLAIVERLLFCAHRLSILPTSSDAPFC